MIAPYRPDPCFHVKHLKRDCWDGHHDDGCPHHDSISAAADEMQQLWEVRVDADASTPLPDPPGEWIVEPLSEPCLLVTCDGCGDTYENEDSGSVLHAPDGETADQQVRDGGWVVDGDKHYCRTCAAENRDVSTARAPGPHDVPLF